MRNENVSENHFSDRCTQKKLKTENEISAEEDENDDENQFAANETNDKIPVIEKNIDDKTTVKTEYVVDIIVGHSVKRKTVLYRVR